MRISDWSSDVCSSDLGESTLRPSGRRTALLAEQVFAFPETDRRILEGEVVVEIECRRCQIVLRNHLRRPGLALRRPPGRASDASEAARGLSLSGCAAMSLGISRGRPDVGHEGLRRALDRKSVVSGKSVSVRVDLGGRVIFKKKKTQLVTRHTN